MIGLARLLLRSIWLAAFILGARRALELLQRGADELIDRIDEGDTRGIVRTMVRAHEALHRLGGKQAGGSGSSGATGET